MLLPYHILDVFTPTPFLGSPLAIVTIPPNTPLSTPQKQRIAKEFNLSETVFVHAIPQDSSDLPAQERHFDIFTPSAELPFAGHPTIGTAVHLHAQGVTTLICKAGRIEIDKVASSSSSTSALRAKVPHDVRLHQQRIPSPISTPSESNALQRAIAEAEIGAPLFSIVNGMAFALIELPSLAHLSAVRVGVAPELLAELLDEGWRGGWITRRYYYVLLDSSAQADETSTCHLRTRMVKVTPAMEDPATGSAACALGSYLSLYRFRAQEVRFEITQGVEMGRESKILIDARVEQDDEGVRKLQTLHLGGTAVQVASGEIAVPT